MSMEKSILFCKKKENDTHSDCLAGTFDYNYDIIKIYSVHYNTRIVLFVSYTRFVRIIILVLFVSYSSTRTVGTIRRCSFCSQVRVAIT